MDAQERQDGGIVFAILNKSARRIEIHFDFNAHIVAKVKALPDRRFHVQTNGKFWSVPSSAYHAAQVVSKLKPLGFSIAEEIFELSKAVKPAKVTAVDMPGLMDFQKECVQFMRGKGGRGIFGDQPGLGKTVESLTYMRVEGAKLQRVVVIAPASVIYKWLGDSQRWLDESWTAAVVEKSTGPLPTTRLLIMSYTIATRRYRDIVKLQPDLIVWDECHNLKGNPKKVQRVRAARQYAVGTPRLIGASGSPLLNRPQELWNILNIIDPMTWNNWYDFMVRYAGAVKTDFGWDFQGSTNQSELAERLKSVMIRHLKSEVLDQLPALRRVILPVKVDMKDYKAIRKAKHTNPLAKLNALRQESGRSKVPAALSWAQDFLEGDGGKLVIYAHHREVVDALMQELRVYGVSCITGDTPKKERMDRIAAFQSRPLPRVMVITQAGGEGIDLFAASDILFCEREWSPIYEEQVEARLHRIGQHSPVTAWYLAAQGTVDEHFARLVDSKREMFHSIIGNEKIETTIQEELLEKL